MRPSIAALYSLNSPSFASPFPPPAFPSPPPALSTCFPSPAPLPVGLSVSVLSLSSSLGECIEGMLGEIRLSHGSEIEDESG